MEPEKEVLGEGATSPEPVTLEEKTVQDAPTTPDPVPPTDPVTEVAPETIPSPADYLPAPEQLKQFRIPQEIIIKIAQSIAQIPDGDSDHRVRCFNEILAVMQTRFNLKLDAEPMLVNGMIFARPTVLLSEDIQAKKDELAAKKAPESDKIVDNKA